MATSTHESCKICSDSRLGGSSYCELHSQAKLKLEEAYSAWVKAYSGKIGRAEFLKAILEHDEAGQAGKDVASALLKEEASE